MKVNQLFEDVLDDLERTMKLRSTKSHISQEKAEECHKWLTSQGYRWSLEETGEGIRYLRIVQASIKKQAWRSKPGMTERYLLNDKLKSFGFSVGPHRINAIMQQSGFPGPHVFFW